MFALWSSQIAAVSPELEPGSLLGPQIMSLVTTLRYSHGISYNRMSQMLGDLFRLTVSEGGIANLLSRVNAQLAPEVERIVAANSGRE